MRIGKRAMIIASAALMIMPMLLLANNASGVPPGRLWTVMVYIDADNNLEQFGVMNLEQLETVGSTSEVALVVLIDTYSGPASLLYVEKGQSKVLAEWGEVNMADPATMSKFIKTAEKSYPAQNTAFISWDHGGGWRGLNWDDTSEMLGEEPSFMDMNTLRIAVADAGVRFDVFAFDQCLMAQPEVAYQVRGYADYLVFSEETVYGQGFPYDMLAGDIVAMPSMDAKGMAVTMVENFAEYYNSITWANDWTISAFDMSSMDALTAGITHLASTSLDALTMYRSQFKNDLAGTDNYYYPYFHDLKGYAMNVASDKAILDKAVKSAATEVVNALDDGIVLAMNSKHNINSYGMSIYFPGAKSSYLGLKSGYADVPFAVDTGWLAFLMAFGTNK
jgi:hypothetical protein